VKKDDDIIFGKVFIVELAVYRCMVEPKGMPVGQFLKSENGHRLREIMPTIGAGVEEYLKLVSAMRLAKPVIWLSGRGRRLHEDKEDQQNAVVPVHGVPL
jgi:hypothetical protein